MKKLMIVGAGAVGVASMALLGAGAAAAAPAVVGMTYADASDEIDSSGGEPVVAVTVGGRMDDDDCIVTNAWDAPFVRGDGEEFEHAEGEVMLSLNCNGEFATATNPGASVASPLGSAAHAAAEEAASAEEEELAAASTPDE